MHCHFVVTFLSVTGRDTLDLHSTTILKLMFLWCVMPFQLNHLRSYNCLLNSKVIEIVVLTIHLWICLCTTQGFKADFCWNKMVDVSFCASEGDTIREEGRQTIITFFFFSGAEGISQTQPPFLCHQSCSWVPKWPHDGCALSGCSLWARKHFVLGVFPHYNIVIRAR